MKRRIYFALLLSAVTGLVALGAGVPQKQKEGDRQTLPESWRGTWEVTVAYRERATGSLVATDVTTTAICPGEPIIPSLLDTPARCTVEADGGELSVWCRGKHSPRPGCNQFIEAQLDSQRDSDTWSGNGSWTAKVVGNCKEKEDVNIGEDFVVTGTRISNAAACDGVQASLIHRFFAHGALVSVLGGGN